MADISHLRAQESVETLDLNTYQDIGGGANRPRFQFPKAGRYTLRAPDAFPQEAFGETKSGALSVQIDPTIVGPTNEGLVVRFQRINGTSYMRKGKPVSKIGDYLRACGVSGVSLSTRQEIADAIEQTANTIYEAFLDWRLYAKGHAPVTDLNPNGALELRGMDNFPKDAEGNPVPYVNSQIEKNEDGTPKRLRANLEIAFFLPAGS